MSSKNQKKIKKLQDDITRLEEQLRISLGKKTHNSAEINVPKMMEQIRAKKLELQRLTINNT